MRDAESSAGVRLLPLGLTLFALGGGGCSYVLVSPPARMVERRIGQDRGAGRDGGGRARRGLLEHLDSGVALGSVGVRRGVEEGIEVNADATWARAVYDEYSDIDRNIFAARVGGKVANRGGWAAVTGGVGGGVAPAGVPSPPSTWAASCLYPNCYAVPFGNGSVFTSLPIGAKQVDFRNQDGTLVASDKAALTYGFGLGVGLEIPVGPRSLPAGVDTRADPDWPELRHSDSHRPHAGHKTTTNSDGTTTTTTTEHDRYGALGLAVGVEFPF